MRVERLSVFDIFKIGVGPSSSHTLGPWRAAQDVVRLLHARGVAGRVRHLRVDLFGSLAKTGRGHGTDIALQAGLLGADPETCDMTAVRRDLDALAATGALALAPTAPPARFVPREDIVFHRDRVLPRHPNALTVVATLDDGTSVETTYYSVGGGFIERDGADDTTASAGSATVPCPVDTAQDLLRWCDERAWPIWRIVQDNERTWRTDAETAARLQQCWTVMQDCIHRGCQADGELPGGLHVVRRAGASARRLLGPRSGVDRAGWVDAIRAGGHEFGYVLDWVSTWALAVNEENATFGRVVTAPTNGAAGVVPAVLTYLTTFCSPSVAPAPDTAHHHTPDPIASDPVARFLLTASQLGCLFKTGATISAAMGGCQAEIGVSSAMAAAALAEALGATPRQALMAAEIAMEHHLGLTCDPVAGLVQIPCIERNTMGAVKAITAAQLALHGDPTRARVSLDAVIRTMRQTALDMSSKYKETAEGGLAVQISVNLSEC